MGAQPSIVGQHPQQTAAFYRRTIAALWHRDVPFLVGGGYAFARYTGIERPTKDLDLFVRPQHAEWALGAIQEAGYATQMLAPHWLGKAFCDGDFIDVVFSSGNGVAVVDDEWFTYAEQSDVLGVPVDLCPVEETIWSKAYVLERERYDGADVAHLLRARGDRLDWERLLRRFDSHWPVLFSHLLLFRFVYPSHRALVPEWVLDRLLARMRYEFESDAPHRRLCQGTLLSARQYLVDVERWDYEDARLDPKVQMTAADIDLLTRAIKAEELHARGRIATGRSR